MKKTLRKAGELIAALLFALGIPILIKQFVLRPIRFRIIGDNTAGQVFQWGISLLLILGGYILYVRLIEKRKVRELSPAKALSHLGKGGVWGILSIGLVLAILSVSGVFKITGTVKSIGSYQMILLVFLLSTTEEIMYRGILHRMVEKWAGTAMALFVSSTIFSIMHLTNNHYNLLSFAAIVTGGAVMGLMFSATGNLWWPIAAHFTWNFTQIFMGIRLSGMDEFSNLAVFESELNGHPLLTGGQFGVENSMVTIAYTTIAALLLGYLIFKGKIPVRSLTEAAESTP